MILIVIISTLTCVSIELVLSIVALKLLDKIDTVILHQKTAYLVAVLGCVFSMVIVLIYYFKLTMPYLKEIDKLL